MAGEGGGGGAAGAAGVDVSPVVSEGRDRDVISPWPGAVRRGGTRPGRGQATSLRRRAWRCSRAAGRGAKVVQCVSGSACRGSEGGRKGERKERGCEWVSEKDGEIEIGMSEGRREGRRKRCFALSRPSGSAGSPTIRARSRRVDKLQASSGNGVRLQPAQQHVSAAWTRLRRCLNRPPAAPADCSIARRCSAALRASTRSGSDWRNRPADCSGQRRAAQRRAQRRAGGLPRGSASASRE